MNCMTFQFLGFQFLGFLLGIVHFFTLGVSTPGSLDLQSGWIVFVFLCNPSI